MDKIKFNDRPDEAVGHVLAASSPANITTAKDILNWLGNNIDYSKIDSRSYMVLGNVIYRYCGLYMFTCNRFSYLGTLYIHTFRLPYSTNDPEAWRFSINITKIIENENVLEEAFSTISLYYH